MRESSLQGICVLGASSSPGGASLDPLTGSSGAGGFPSLDLIVQANGVLLVVAWILLGLALAAAVKNQRVLARILEGGRPGGNEPAAPGSPSISVIVTARDEVDEIETTVRSLLRQRADGLEIIVVDDRSSDGTGAVLDRLVHEHRQDGRLRVIHNTALPEGWLGKCHACHLGARGARGEWLLFADGDVAFVGDDLLARVVLHAEAERLDHVAVVPDMEPMPVVQTALVSVFGQMYLLATRAYEVNRDRPRGGVGIGAFNLVRRGAYERVGGHERLRLDPGDDLKLGQLLKESGARQRLYDGIGLVKCPWHRGALNVVRGLEKNAFSACRYSIGILLAVSAACLWVAVGPLVSAAVSMATAVSGGASPRATAVGLAPLVVQMAFLSAGFVVMRARGHRGAFASVLLHPMAALLLVGAMWNSAVRTLTRGGMEWRGTFYPLEALRTGLVRPGEGRRPAPVRSASPP